MTGKAKVLWFTGLSGSGKSTLAEKIKTLLEEKKYKVKLLEGDVIRKEINSHLGFTPADIKVNNEKIIRFCQTSLDRYDYIIVSVIAPFKATRRRAQEILADNYIEIYVKASLDEVVKRDVKGLYNRALNGEIDNFIGISPDTPYEPPVNPSLIIDTEKYSVAQSADLIFKHLNNHGLIEKLT